MLFLLIFRLLQHRGLIHCEMIPAVVCYHDFGYETFIVRTNKADRFRSILFAGIEKQAALSSSEGEDCVSIVHAGNGTFSDSVLWIRIFLYIHNSVDNGTGTAEFVLSNL